MRELRCRHFPSELGVIRLCPVPCWDVQRCDRSNGMLILRCGLVLRNNGAVGGVIVVPCRPILPRRRVGMLELRCGAVRRINGCIGVDLQRHVRCRPIQCFGICWMHGLFRGQLHERWQ